MSEEARPLHVVVVGPMLPALAPVIELIRGNRKERIIVTETAVEASQKIINEDLSSVVILSARGEEDFAVCLQFCKNLLPSRSIINYKIMVVTTIENPKVKRVFTSMGVSEFLKDKTPARSLAFKVSFLLNQVGNMNQKTGDRVIRGGGRGAANEKITVAGGVQVSNEIIGEDIWLIKGVAPRKIGVQWVIEAEGPDPDSGAWEQLGVAEDRQEQWAWRPDGAPKLTENSLADGWTFRGNKPAVDPETGKWKFVSNRPNLSVNDRGRKTASKVEFKDKEIILAADNPAAEAKIAESKKIGEAVRARRQRELAARVEAGDESAVRELAEQERAAQRGRNDAKAATARAANEANAAANEERRRGTARGGPDAGEDDGPGDAAARAKARERERGGRGAAAVDDGDESSSPEARATAARREKEAAEAKARAVTEGKAAGQTGAGADESASSARARTAGEKNSAGVGDRSETGASEAMAKAARVKLDEASATETAARAAAAALERAEATAAIERARQEKERAEAEARAHSRGERDQAAAAKAQGEREAREARAARMAAAASAAAGQPTGVAADQTAADVAKAARARAVPEGERPETEAKTGADDPALTPTERAAQDRARAEAAAKAALDAAQGRDPSRVRDPRALGEAAGDYHPAANLVDSGLLAAADGVQKNFAFKRTNGVMRGTKMERPLTRTSNAHFGSDSGLWEPVGDHGWIYLTPEMKSNGADYVLAMQPLWYLARTNDVDRPRYDAHSRSWLIDANVKPIAAATFPDLPAPYQDFLVDLAQNKRDVDYVRTDFENKLQDRHRETWQDFERFDDLDDQSGPAKKISHLKFLLTLSDLGAAKRPREDVCDAVVEYVTKTLALTSATVVETSPSGRPVVVASTDQGSPRGHEFTFAYGTVVGPNVPVEPQMFAASDAVNVYVHPLARGHGALVLTFASSARATVVGQANFLGQMSRHLGALLKPPRKVG